MTWIGECIVAFPFAAAVLGGAAFFLGLLIGRASRADAARFRAEWHLEDAPRERQ